MEENKETQRIDEYNKRMALIKSKYPNIYDANTPKSIQDEFRALNGLVNALKTPETWGNVQVEEGIQVDRFVLDRYNQAKQDAEKLKGENTKYIAKEEEEAFKLPEIDIEAIKQEIANMKDSADSTRVQNMIYNENNQYLPTKTRQELKKLGEEWGRKSFELYEISIKEPSNNLPVEQPQKGSFISKITKTWQKIKDRIKQAIKPKQNKEQIEQVTQENKSQASKRPSVKEEYKVDPSTLKTPQELLKNAEQKQQTKEEEQQSNDEPTL